MRRRQFMVLLAGATALRPLSSIAQQRKVSTIGVLVVGAPGWEQFWQSFSDAMREIGYIEGQSIRYEFRSDQGQIGRLPDLAAELVAAQCRCHCDLVYAGSAGREGGDA